MRIVSRVWLIAVVGCASSGAGSSSPAPDQTVRVIGSAGSSSLTVPGADRSSTRKLANTVDQVWRALPAVFDSLGIPVQTVDPVKHTIGATGFLARHRLKNVALSRYIDCGNSQMGPAADDYDVRISLLVDVRSADGGAAMVTTTVEAMAKPANYAQDYSRCSTRGTLEDKVFEVLNARLTR